MLSALVGGSYLMENNNQFGMKSIQEAMQVPIGATIKTYLSDIKNLDWFFSKWWEKLGLIAMMLFSFYGIYDIIRRLF